jgi:hypothetical protein
MKTILTKAIQVSVMILALSAFLFSSDYGDGKYYCQSNYTEGDVFIQRANDSQVSELTRNMPIMAGDRIWTENGRAEIQFDDGSLLSLDSGTKLDFEAIGEPVGRYDESTLIKLWGGSLYVTIYHDRNSGQNLQIQTMAGSISLLNTGTYRFDMGEDYSLRLTVFEGLAEVGSNKGNTMVRSGQRLFLEPGDEAMDPVEFADAERDDFSEWMAGRINQYGKDRSAQYVDDSLDYLVDGMDNYGEWKYANDYGSYVWIPSSNYIYDDWRPYNNGTWVWTPHGWTFVSYDPWSWTTYRYGRWDWSPWGWCWIPGYRYSPAWVYWEIGNDYIGWAPIGYYNYPVNRYSWKQYPRGYKPRYGDGKHVDIDVNSWTVVHKGKFGKETISKIAFPKNEIAKINRQDAKIISADYAERGFADRKINSTATKTTVNSPAFKDLPEGAYRKITKKDSTPGSTYGWDSNKESSSKEGSSYTNSYKKKSSTSDSPTKYIYKSGEQQYYKKDSSGSSSSTSKSKSSYSSSSSSSSGSKNTVTKSGGSSSSQSSAPVKKKDSPSAYYSDTGKLPSNNSYNNTKMVYRFTIQERYTNSEGYQKNTSSYNSGNENSDSSSTGYKKYYSSSSEKPYYGNSSSSWNSHEVKKTWSGSDSGNYSRPYTNYQKQTRIPTTSSYKFEHSSSASSPSSSSSHSYSVPRQSYSGSNSSISAKSYSPPSSSSSSSSSSSGYKKRN